MVDEPLPTPDECDALFAKLLTFRATLVAGEQMLFDQVVRWQTLTEHDVPDQQVRQPPPGWTEIGRVAIDSATMVLADPANLEWASTEFYRQFDAGLLQEDHGQLANEYAPLAAWVRTGYADGLYAVYARIAPHPWVAGERIVQQILVEFD